MIKPREKHSAHQGWDLADLWELALQKGEATPMLIAAKDLSPDRRPSASIGGLNSSVTSVPSVVKNPGRTKWNSMQSRNRLFSSVSDESRRIMYAPLQFVLERTICKRKLT